MNIEKDFDITFIASLALREKQVQQNYRPIIAVHKWFARRPGSLFRGLLLSEFGSRPLSESYFTANDLSGRVVADPFMGGGTPVLEANRVGCDIVGFDINPMATWIVREEIEHLDLDNYQAEAKKLLLKLETRVGTAYRTDCVHYGDQDVPVKYFLWVKTVSCDSCKEVIDLFPGYLLADDTRHTHNVLVCPACGQLNETTDLKHPGMCRDCSKPLQVDGPAKRNRCDCPHCGRKNSYPRAQTGAPEHRMFAIEYYNPLRRDGYRGRFFKKPDLKDLARYQEASQRWRSTKPSFVPRQSILPGDETTRLHRWGYQKYRELFNERQLLGLEHSCRLISKISNTRVRHALSTNLSDLLRYQNMLCRYDTMALKSLDIFSVHGFPVGLVQCESNLLGIVNGGGIGVGSGGWRNIIDKYAKAKRYCTEPFEVRFEQGRKTIVPIIGEWIGETSKNAKPRSVAIHCASSTSIKLPPNSLDAVLTDPPYFGNVQYGELMDFCYVWLRRLVGAEPEGFNHESSRSPDELTGNATQARGLEHFAEGLSATYKTMAQSLKPGAPLAFTFHHNKLDAYHTVGVAILDANLFCSATFPCPAEMGGSIHIKGTGSSIVDTVFVCRDADSIRNEYHVKSALSLEDIVRADLVKLCAARLKPTTGDIRCIIFGHMTRLAVQRLHKEWDSATPIQDRLRLFAEEIQNKGNPDLLIESLFKEFQLFQERSVEPLPLFSSEVPRAISF